MCACVCVCGGGGGGMHIDYMYIDFVLDNIICATQNPHLYTLQGLTCNHRLLTKGVINLC